MTLQRPPSLALLIAAALVACAVLPLPAAAELTGSALVIRAVNASGDAATFEIAAPAEASSWTWSTNERIEMRSPVTGDLIAVLNPDGRATSVEYVGDPVVALSFNVQAGPSTTNFQIASALLSFPVITAEGRATAGLSLTDFDGDGATLTGVGDPSGSQGAYLAQYNGFAGTLSGTTFAEVIHSMSAGAFATSTASADVPPLGFLQIVDPVGDMSVLFSFTLTAFDLASRTSTFVIQPLSLAVEPSTWARVKALFD
jgi:hypothetical protein